MANYANKNDLTLLAQGIRDRLVIDTNTESQALALSSDYPNCVFYTSDTRAIIVGGAVYGRGSTLSAAFRLVADTSGQATWDTNCIYLVPTGTSGQFSMYSYNGGAWVLVSTQTINVSPAAADVTYDLTNTPTLGNGNVQSAIEATLQAIKEEKWEFMRESIPASTLTSLVGSRQQNKCTYNTTTAVTQTSTAWGIFWGLGQLPKGTLIHMSATYSTAHALRFAISDASPEDYYTNNSNSIVGFQFDELLYNETKKVNDVWFELPRTTYISYSRCTSNVTQSLSIQYYVPDYYKKLHESS